MANRGPDNGRLHRLLVESTRGSLLWSASRKAGHPELIDKLVGFLRSKEYSISDLQCVIDALKDQNADRHYDPAQILQYWRELDAIFAACLEQTAAVHEAALECSHHSYCEVDDGEKIVFANEAMLKLVPGCRGQVLPSYFEDQAEFVRTALRGNAEPGLHQMQMLTGERRIPVNAEFGPVELGAKRRGGYAILVDTSPFVEAERKAYDASPLGIVQLDRRQRIRSANSKAIQIFGGNEAELLGRDARELFQDLASKQLIEKELQKRSQGEGSKYHLLFRQPSSGRITPLLIGSTPEFDNRNQVVGTRAEIEALDIDDACRHISKACERNTYGPELLEAIVSIVREMMPFDGAALAVLSTDATLARIVYTIPDPKALGPAQRILPISPELVAWASSCERWSSNLEEFASTPPGEALHADPIVRGLIAAGYRSLICVPVSEASQLSAVLVLLTKHDGSFGPMHRDLLEQLGLENTLRNAVEAFELAERTAYLYDLLKAIPAARTGGTLALELVRGLARSYHWQHVSIFKVDRRRRRFRLLAQAQTQDTSRGFLLPENHEQPIEDGMLGLTYRKGEPQAMNHIDEGSEAARFFILADKTQPTQSELCFPVRLDGRIDWIINLEDARPGMFAEPKRSRIISDLEYIVKELEQALERRFQDLLFEQIFEAATDAIVIADTTGLMIRHNNAATRMLQIDKETEQRRRLSEFTSDHEHKSLLNQDGTVNQLKVQIRGQQGGSTRVLVNAFNLHDEYEYKVFFLKDLESIELQRDMQAIGGAVAEVAQQARVPLSLAASFVRRIGQLMPEDLVRELVGRAVQQLTKVEFTHDRVLAGYDRARLGPTRVARLLLADLLLRLLEELPASERDGIRAWVPERSLMVLGDPFRLSFVLQSIIAYLLRAKARSETIGVLIWNDLKEEDEGRVRICITGPEPAVGAAANAAPGELPPGDENISAAAALSEATETARAVVALGEPTLMAIISEHGGEYSHDVMPHAGTDQATKLVARFQLTFPSNETSVA